MITTLRTVKGILMALVLSVLFSVVVTILEYVIANEALPPDSFFWFKYPGMIGIILGITGFMMGSLYYSLRKREFFHSISFATLIILLGVYSNRAIFCKWWEFTSFMGITGLYSLSGAVMSIAVFLLTFLFIRFFYRISGWRNAFAVLLLLSFMFITGCIAHLMIRENEPERGISDEMVNRSSGQEKLPNIFIFSIDTLRTDYLGCYGHPGNLTPHMDAFAEESHVYTRCYSASPWTRSSFASLMTSRYPHEHGAVSKRFVFTGRRSDYIQVYDQPVLDGPAWLPLILSGKGYTTACFQGNDTLSPEYNFARGFQEYVMARELQRYKPLSVIMMSYLGYPDHNLINYNVRLDSENLTNACINRINRHASSETPLFLWLVLLEVHEPHVDPLTPRKDVRESDLIRMIEFRTDSSIRQQVLDAYPKEVRYVDTLLGRILDSLRANGLYDDSIIIIHSDHGQELYDYDSRPRDPLFNHIYAFGHGHSLSDELLHVPLMLKYPGCSAAVQDTPCSILDVMPSLLALISADSEETREIRGELLPGIGSGTSDSQRLIFCESTAYGSERKCVIRDNEKLEWFGAPPGTDVRIKDGYRNWKGDGPVDPELQNTLQEFVRDSLAGEEKILDGSQPVEPDPETVERLKSLGYLP